MAIVELNEPLIGKVQIHIKMNTTTKAAKAAYEKLACGVLEIQPQGVLCSSMDVDITAAGSSNNQLDVYSGKAL